MTAYRNFENEISESDSGTTISGFADSKKKQITRDSQEPV